MQTVMAPTFQEHLHSLNHGLCDNNEAAFARHGPRAIGEYDSSFFV